MRKVFVLLIPVFLAAAAFGQVSKKTIDRLHLPWISFYWQGDSLAGRYFDKAAIFIPVGIDDLPYHFAMQFDLGAVTTEFYEIPMTPYLRKSPALYKKLDSPFYHHIDLTLDKIRFADLTIAHHAGFGDSLSIDSAWTTTPKLVGTIAPDLFKDKILLIDYPNQRICMVSQLPDWIEKRASFVPIKIQDGRISVPFTVGGKPVALLFDTGSSIFSIVTSGDHMVDFAGTGNAMTDTVAGGESWGQKVTFYGKPISGEVRLGGHLMPPSSVYYTPDVPHGWMVEAKVVGLTGNGYFMKNIVIVDYKALRFGVM